MSVALGRRRVLGLFQQFQQLEHQAVVGISPAAADAVPTAPAEAVDATQEVVDAPEKEFIWNTLLDYPGFMGGERLWELWRKRLGGKAGGDLATEKAEFLRSFRSLRARFGKMREREKTAFRKKREVRRLHKSLMGGYKAEEAASEARGKVDEVASMREDVAKARYYAELCEEVAEAYPTAGDQFDDSIRAALRGALRTQTRDELRPVLTHELADFRNPYLMVRTTRERLLHKVAVRSKFEEALVDELLDEDAELARLRSRQGDLMPPEVLEPLMAFRGVTRWSSDASERLRQKLEAVNEIIDSVASEKSQGERSSSWRWKHPYKNHLGFESVAKDERLGGWNFGRPESEDRAEIRRMRYPTLQRVAHSLAADPVYRSVTSHTIDVLERSKGWSFADKIKAVNTMKEVVDNLPSSGYYAKKLDKALPLNRLRLRRARPGSLPLKLYKTFPRNWRTRSRLGIYHKSFVATKSLANRQSERRQKDADRKKKEEREKKQAQLAKKKK